MGRSSCRGLHTSPCKGEVDSLCFAFEAKAVGWGSNGRTSIDAQDDIARVVLHLAGSDESPWRLRPTNAKRSPSLKQLPPVANSRPRSRCGPVGASTACEASLHPSGPCRPRLDPRLHRGPVPTRRKVGSGAHTGDHRPSLDTPPPDRCDVVPRVTGFAPSFARLSSAPLPTATRDWLFAALVAGEWKVAL